MTITEVLEKNSASMVDLHEIASSNFWSVKGRRAKIHFSVCKNCFRIYWCPKEQMPFRYDPDLCKECVDCYSYSKFEEVDLGEIEAGITMMRMVE